MDIIIAITISILEIRKWLPVILHNIELSDIFTTKGSEEHHSDQFPTLDRHLTNFETFIS